MERKWKGRDSSGVAVTFKKINADAATTNLRRSLPQMLTADIVLRLTMDPRRMQRTTHRNKPKKQT